ncbi:MAG: outer membrane beta-barrel protein [Ferruginibacter sp.]
MRKFIFIAFAFFTIPSFAQTTKKNRYDLSERAADHLMLQFSSDHWTNVPDSIDSHINGFSRGGNIYLMLDKPFKGNQKVSVGIGVGVGTSSIFFKRMEVGIESTTAKLPFVNTDTTSYFKKYKVATSFLEAPLELRYSSNPATPNKAFKMAIGIKGGVLLNAHTKGKNLKSNTNTVINSYTQKLLSKSFFNTSRFVATARVGYGIFGIFGAYNFTSVFKDGVAPDMKLYQVGITLSGL